MHLERDSFVKSLKPEELKEIVLRMQNQEQKGYYTLQEWGEIHQSLLGVQKTVYPVLNAWRLLKLINFGDDYVPTGLIYDTLITLLDLEKPPQQTEVLIKSIFFKFIEFNGKILSEKEQEELAFFKIIKSVTQGYRQILAGDTSLLDISEKSNRTEQLHRLHNVYTYKKNLQALKKIDLELKNCKFQPKINTKKEMVQSRYLQPKINFQLKLQEEKYNFNCVIDEQEEYRYNFKANPVPYYPQVIPVGLNQHLLRMQKSREIKRINGLKSSHSNSNVITPFGLQQRQNARKQKLLNNFKLLFLIKVEVGKRIYRIKVRGNMGVQQVVKNIELMVGFQDQTLTEIVESYFSSYRNRQKQRSTIYQQF